MPRDADATPTPAQLPASPLALMAGGAARKPAPAPTTRRPGASPRAALKSVRTPHLVPPSRPAGAHGVPLPRGLPEAKEPRPAPREPIAEPAPTGAPAVAPAPGEAPQAPHPPPQSMGAALFSFSSQLDGALAGLDAPPAAPAGPGVQPILEFAALDSSLEATLHAGHVHVALETEAAGALQVDLRLHEGRADVRLDGPASPLLAQHAEELRKVLGAEGLTLGGFDLGRDERRPPPADAEAPLAARSPAPSGSVSDPSPQARHGGRIHVKA